MAGFSRSMQAPMVLTGYSSTIMGQMNASKAEPLRLNFLADTLKEM
jgi:hypothetical protein